LALTPHPHIATISISFFLTRTVKQASNIVNFGENYVEGCLMTIDFGAAETTREFAMVFVALYCVGQTFTVSAGTFHLFAGRMRRQVVTDIIRIRNHSGTRD
jgi:hypothetical protein